LKLYLVRHGQTDLNKERRYQGRIDVPLNDTGIQQARCLSMRLSSEPISKIYVSPMIRAQETARIIDDGRKIDISTCADLVEMSFGQLEGKTYEEIIKIFPQWDSSVFDFTFAGGENLDSLVKRIKSFKNTLATLEDDTNVLVICHTGCLRVFLCLLLDIDVSRWWRFKIDLASLTVIEHFKQNPVLALLNDTSYLNGK
jgi:alpha-ribazole phosphatase